VSFRVLEQQKLSKCLVYSHFNVMKCHACHTYLIIQPIIPLKGGHAYSKMY